MDINKFLQSKTFRGIICGVAALIVLLFVFRAGMFVGFKKANFSFKWGENYHQNFGGPKGGIFQDFRGGDFIDAHGVSGQILKIDHSANSGQVILVIKGRDNVEKIVLIKDNTTIERLQETIKIADLKIDDMVVVIGEPNDSGQMAAKFIRVLPFPPPRKESFRPLLPPMRR